MTQERHLDPNDFERVGPYFSSRFGGWCTIDSDHPVKSGDRVGRVRRRDNPFIVVTGVACKKCLPGLPVAAR